MAVEPTTKYPKINGTDFCYLIGRPIQQNKHYFVLLHGENFYNINPSRENFSTHDEHPQNHGTQRMYFILARKRSLSRASGGRHAFAEQREETRRRFVSTYRANPWIRKKRKKRKEKEHW